MMRNLLLVGGPGHEFDEIAESLDRVLRTAEVATTVVTHPDEMIEALVSTDSGGGYDLLTVHALHWGMAADRYAHLRDEHAYHLRSADAGVIGDFVSSGGGLLALHTAVVCFDAEPIWHELCGAAWHWEQSSHPSLGAAEVSITEEGRDHPITAGVGDFSIVDEIYGFLDEQPGLVPLLVGSHGGRRHPLLWARAVGAGRVVTDLLGHDAGSIDHPVHGPMLCRAARWAGGATTESVVDMGPVEEVRP